MVPAVPTCLTYTLTCPEVWAMYIQDIVKYQSTSNFDVYWYFSSNSSSLFLLDFLVSHVVKQPLHQPKNHCQKGVKIYPHDVIYSLWGVEKMKWVISRGRKVIGGWCHWDVFVLCSFLIGIKHKHNGTLCVSSMELSKYIWCGKQKERENEKKNSEKRKFIVFQIFPSLLSPLTHIDIERDLSIFTLTLFLSSFPLTAPPKGLLTSHSSPSPF